MLANWRKRVIDEMSQQVYELVIWPEHFLRRVNAEVDFSFINELCAPAYHNGSSQGGRAAEAPERIFRALLLLVLYGLPSETCLVREIGVNLAFRWFCGLGLGERVFDHSLFYVVRQRLGVARFEQVLARIFQQCMEQGLVSHEWAFYDMTAIEASATVYTPYERAVILARAVWRLLESGPVMPAGGDPNQPLAEAEGNLKRLVAEVAKEVVQAKQSRVVNIERGMEQLAKKQEQPAQSLGQREGVARQLSQGQEQPTNLSRQAIKTVMEAMKERMPHAKGDQTARVGRVKKGEYFCGYLSGIMIDGKYNIIGATHLEPGNAFQAHALLNSGVAEVYKINAGQAPAQAAFDAAFGYPGVVLHLAQLWPQSQVFVEPHPPPPLRPEQRQIFLADQFTLLEDDRLLCPNTALPESQRQMRVQARRQDGTLEYAGQGCANCGLRSQCTTKKNGPRIIKLHPQQYRIGQAMQAQAKTPEHKAALRQRMASIEPVFGHGKHHHRWGKALYRSLEMNRIFNCLMAIGLDIEKLVRYAPRERQRAAMTAKA